MVLFHNDCLVINIQNACLFQLASLVSGNPHDLGSSPRSSPFPYYFFTNIPMQFKPWRPPCIPWSRLPRAHRDWSSGSDQRSTMIVGQHTCSLAQKSTRLCKRWAQIAIIHLLFGDRTPLGLQNFYYSLFFFHYFYILLITVF